MSQFTFIDLFAGIGGFRMALESAGARPLFSSEIDKHSRLSYRHNFGDEPAGDINAVELSDIPSHDILVGGFPCQPFSIAGVSKKNSLGRQHGFRDRTQGTLFFRIAEILDHHRPAAFILENVKNLKGHDRGRTFKTILETFAELNYLPFYQIIDASGFVPQHRERIFIVGFDLNRFDPWLTFDFPQMPTQRPALKTILEPTVDPKYTLSDKLWQWLQDYAASHRKRGNGFGYGLADPEGITRTLSARYYKDGSEILLPVAGSNPRRLTPRECARLMGFGDEFKIPVSDTQAYRQFGNAVVVPVAAAVARAVVEKLSELNRTTKPNNSNSSSSTPRQPVSSNV